ncbi:MAG TPA: TIGR02677 family protein [Clostridiaceae bacterium]|nr:TIGR02677 family protein [Clostridiaceae bacterium]
MEINVKLTKQIEEVRYLTVDNSWRYRAILRFFYLSYEKMKYWMYKEDIYEELKKHEQFSQYTMDDLKQDLDVLVSWKNLMPIQDTSRVSTVEEFKNKQFRYQMTEYSVEIERLTIKLENLLIETASLEPSLLEYLKEELSKFKSMVSNDDKTVGAWWRALNENFKRLNQNYQDYIGDFYSMKAEEMMKTKEFLLYKEKFIDYFRDFIKGLQNNSGTIEAILQDISAEDEKAVLEKVFNYEMAIPRLDTDVPEEEIMDNINGKWSNLKNWFLGSDGSESEASRLLDITNEIIRKITRFASQISESRNSAANRKEEYRKLASMFLDCESIEDAHKLSSLCFGIFNTKHIKCDLVRKTESINSGVFDEEPYIYTIKPRIRYYREKAIRNPIANNEERKAKMLEKVMAERQRERKIVEGYIKDGCIRFDSLPEIKREARVTLLRWLAKGINSPDGRAKTEHGRVYRIIVPENIDEKCILKCEDGTFEMPPYIIYFEQESAV